MYKNTKSTFEKIPKEEKTIFIGDLIDRGSKSMEVIKLVRDRNFDCVRGNH